MKVDWIERLRKLKEYYKTYNNLAKSLFPQQKQPGRYLRLILSGKRGLSKKVKEKIRRRWYYWTKEKERRKEKKTIRVNNLLIARLDYNRTKYKEVFVEVQVVDNDLSVNDLERVMNCFLNKAVEEGHTYFDYIRGYLKVGRETTFDAESSTVEFITNKPYDELKRVLEQCFLRITGKSYTVVMREIKVRV